jgi:hypothetical protein
LAFFFSTTGITSTTVPGMKGSSAWMAMPMSVAECLMRAFEPG